MATKIAKFLYNSDSNQLAYNGTPGNYAGWSMTTEEDEEFDNDGVPVHTYAYSFAWEGLTKEYSPVIISYRVKDDSQGSQSQWSHPVVAFTPVRYAIYKRRVAAIPTSWTRIEVVTKPIAGPYQESWAGRVQYAVGIYHINGTPSKDEGVTGTDFSNQYVLFGTAPLDTKNMIV